MIIRLSSIDWGNRAPNPGRIHSRFDARRKQVSDRHLHFFRIGANFQIKRQYANPYGIPKCMHSGSIRMLA